MWLFVLFVIFQHSLVAINDFPSLQCAEESTYDKIFADGYYCANRLTYPHKAYLNIYGLYNLHCTRFRYSSKVPNCHCDNNRAQGSHCIIVDLSYRDCDDILDNEGIDGRFIKLLIEEQINGQILICDPEHNKMFICDER